MPKIFFVRHGETEANRDKVIASRRVTKLTSQGQTKAKQTGQQLRGLNIKKIITSPQPRARHTAQIIQSELEGQALPILEEPLLMEVDFGELSGKPYDEEGILARADAPGFETSADVQKRIDDLVDKLKAEQQNVLVVSHGRFGAHLRAYLATGDNQKISEVPFLHPGDFEEIDIS